MYKSSTPSQPKAKLNHQIRVPEVQVINDDGKQLGIMPTYQALQLAMDAGFDLVEVGPGATPPIVKIMDYGKYMYQKERKEKAAKSHKPANQEIKTVKIGFRTETHDLNVRATQVNKFLEKGHRVKIEITLRGREKAMTTIARAKLEKFMLLIPLEYITEAPIKNFPGGFSILIRKK